MVLALCKMPDEFVQKLARLSRLSCLSAKKRLFRRKRWMSRSASRLCLCVCNTSVARLESSHRAYAAMLTRGRAAPADRANVRRLVAWRVRRHRRKAIAAAELRWFAADGLAEFDGRRIAGRRTGLSVRSFGRLDFRCLSGDLECSTPPSLPAAPPSSLALRAASASPRPRNSPPSA